MKSKGIFTLALVLIMSLSSTIFAQSFASEDEPVLVQLKKGLSMTKVGGDLDFGEYIITTSDETLTKTNEDGVNFEVIGHADRAITVTFADVTLNNDDWVGANGGTSDNLTFFPYVEATGSNNVYAGAYSIESGGSVNLENDNGIGKLYLWVGGDIEVSTTTNSGDYIGNFTLSVAY